MSDPGFAYLITVGRDGLYVLHLTVSMLRTFIDAEDTRQCLAVFNGFFTSSAGGVFTNFALGNSSTAMGYIVVRLPRELTTAEKTTVGSGTLGFVLGTHGSYSGLSGWDFAATGQTLSLTNQVKMPPCSDESLMPASLTGFNYWGQPAPIVLSWSGDNFGLTSYTQQAFWAAARDPNVSLNTLWTSHFNQMRERAVDVMQYRQLLAQATQNYAVSTLGSSGTPAATLDAIAADILSGSTYSDLLSTYSGAVVTHGEAIKALLEEARRLSDSAGKTAMVNRMKNLVAALKTGKSLFTILDDEGDLVMKDPTAFLLLDRYVKSGIYPS